MGSPIDMLLSVDLAGRTLGRGCGPFIGLAHGYPLGLDVEGIHTASSEIVFNVPCVQQHGPMSDFIVPETAVRPRTLEGAQIDTVGGGGLFGG